MELKIVFAEKLIKYMDQFKFQKTIVNKFLIIMFLVFIVFGFNSCKKSNTIDNSITITTGRWEYVGAFLESESSNTLGDSLMTVPFDTLNYGFWTFHQNHDFIDFISNDSISYGSWDLNKNQDILTISIDSSTFMHNTLPLLLMKYIKEINDEKIVFKGMTFGTSSNTLIVIEVFEHID